jgi:hypothetical protein
LVGITQMPQSMGQPGLAKYTDLPSEKRDESVVLLGVVEREALLLVFACSSILSEEEPAPSQKKNGPLGDTSGLGCAGPG